VAAHSPAPQKREPTPLMLGADFIPIRLGRQGQSVNDRFRVVLQEQVGDFLALLLFYLAITAGEEGGAPFDVVGIAGEEVDAACFEQMFSVPARPRAEAACVRLRRHLHEAANGNPVLQQIGFLLQQGIPFRVCDNGLDPGHLYFIINPAEVVRNKLVGKFHQKVIGPVDGEVFEILYADLNVVVGKVKVAAEQELGLVADLFLKFRQDLAVKVRVKGVAVIVVRRGDEVGNAVGGRELTHPDGYFQGPCAIVDSR